MKLGIDKRWASGMFALAVSAAAFAYPDKPVQYIIPFAAGGESDIAARLQQQTFKTKFNQDMVVVNKPGAGGGLAWSQMNTMPADGHTIVGVNLPHIVLQPLEGTVDYKTEDVTPIYFFHYTPDAIVVAQDSPYKTFADLVKAAREKPGAVSFAGSGTNSANHLAHERLNREFKIKTTYVPFKGTGDMVSSILGNHVSAAMSYSTLAIQQKGKMRMLAVATAQRVPQFPDVPTFKELGIDWVDGAYRGIGVPKSTPADLRKKVSDMMDAINKDPELRKKMVDGGFEVTDISLEKMPAFMKERTQEYLNTAKQMGLVK
ncbi:MAG: tripartite tricarboxylate transporter substrate binding protein [Betaproteobacteria bacterium]|nr:tripartite tricarboxylate transporter substrate binding protein [Betaproteobacteria bacterium]